MSYIHSNFTNPLQLNSNGNKFMERNDNKFMEREYTKFMETNYNKLIETNYNKLTSSFLSSRYLQVYAPPLR